MLGGASPFYPNFYPARWPDHGLCGTPGAQDRGALPGIYKAADGNYRSAGTFDTEERALEVAEEAERHAAVVGASAGGLDPGTRATRTIKKYAPLFLRHHQVEGNTKDTYSDTLRLHVIPFLGRCRLPETDRTVVSNYVTALQEEGRSANTIRQAKVVLGAMFGMAVADGY